ASYTLTRKYLQSGHVPPKSAIRTEEFVNYFKSGYPAPTETDLAIHVESAPSRFAHSNNVRLLKIGIKAREVTEARGPLALTLLIDVSGSMRNGNRLGLVKDAIRTLLTALRPDDSVAIVTFQSNAQVVLEPTAVARVDEILSALSSLNANGSTNLEGGLHLAYPLAERQFQKEGHNRVLIFSDGVANVGLTDPEGILNGIADKRKQGIYLDSFGVGMGNHNDHLLEQLADRGDGSCSYVDTLAEATRIFRKNLSGVFVTVAKDAKIQVEFDPKVVVAYRQIGYENRAIADKDFRNDAIDAGEVGAGHEVVALYEIEMGPQSKAASPAVVRLRYKSVGAGEGAAEVVELEKVVPTQAIADFDKAPDRFRLSAVVAAFADHLRDSYWARKGHLAEVIEETRSLTSLDTAEDKSVAELLTLMQKAKTLIDQRPQFADFDRLLDELKKNNYLRKRYEEVAQGDVKKLLEELEKQNKDLEEQIKKLNESRPR
ncbi:MAG: von Willebrand factor type A domain-containing protein, partial [Planctomycetota bacterium]